MSLDHVDCTLLANNVCNDAVSECQEQMMNLTREYSVSSITVSIIMLCQGQCQQINTNEMM